MEHFRSVPTTQRAGLLTTQNVHLQKLHNIDQHCQHLDLGLQVRFLPSRPLNKPLSCLLLQKLTQNPFLLNKSLLHHHLPCPFLNALLVTYMTPPLREPLSLHPYHKTFPTNRHRYTILTNS